MQKGTIKWFNNAKGWGFITSSESHSDVFLHFSAIVDKGYKKLKRGNLYSIQPRSAQANYMLLKLSLLIQKANVKILRIKKYPLNSTQYLYKNKFTFIDI